MRRAQLNTTIDLETSSALDALCAQHGISRSALLRGAIDRLLVEAADPWVLGYAEGIRSGHADVQPLLGELLASMRASAEIVNAYADRVRQEAIARAGSR